MRTRTFALCLLLTACAKSAPSPTPPAPDPVPSPQPGTIDPEQRPGLSAAACEAEGGTVVGDIGDGAIHRADYRCPGSGDAPIGNIVAEPDGPMGVEGAVCCK